MYDIYRARASKFLQAGLLRSFFPTQVCTKELPGTRWLDALVAADCEVHVSCSAAAAALSLHGMAILRLHARRSLPTRLRVQPRLKTEPAVMQVSDSTYIMPDEEIIAKMGSKCDAVIGQLTGARHPRGVLPRPSLPQPTPPPHPTYPNPWIEQALSKERCRHDDSAPSPAPPLDRGVGRDSFRGAEGGGRQGLLQLCRRCVTRDSNSTYPAWVLCMSRCDLTFEFRGGAQASTTSRSPRPPAAASPSGTRPAC